jgi:hypothetical protein
VTTNGQQTPARETVPKRASLEEAAALLAEQYRLLVAPDQIVELRALGVQRHGARPHTEAGFFDHDHLLDLAKTALRVTPYAKGVYFTLNPLHPDLLARRCNRTDWANEGELAKDKDILARRWLLIDADPVRDPLISASEEEKAAAHRSILDVREFLRSRFWPDPLLADSGNGYHLLYPIDLPADDSGMVERILRALAHRFDNDHVQIDRSVFNPSRICKLPGTLARKGDDTPKRPHRRAKLLEGPCSEPNPFV